MAAAPQTSTSCCRSADVSRDVSAYALLGRAFYRGPLVAAMRAPPALDLESILNFQPAGMRGVGAVQVFGSFFAARLGDSDSVSGLVVAIDLAADEIRSA